jgi:predicted DNA-binding transcriptional regulator AlpA
MTVADQERTLNEIQTWLAHAPPGTLVPAELFARVLTSFPDGRLPDMVQQPASWRERLWIVPPETRLGVTELLEALGRTRSWLYRHTGPNSRRARMPHRKLDGELLFLAGEVREWIIEQEVTVVPGHTASAAVARPQRRV